MAGLLLAAAGLALFVRAPVDGSFLVDVLPSMILLGFGAGMAFNPLLLAAMSDVAPRGSRARLGRREHGVHDGRRARARRPRQPRRARAPTACRRPGRAQARRSTGGYHLAFLAGAVFAVVGALLSAFLLREGAAVTAHGEDPAGSPAYADAD